MLQLKINENAIDLYAAQKGSFRYNNPCFGNNSSGYTLPFTVPKSALNVRLLNYIDRLDTKSEQCVQNASVWIGGIPFDHGVLKIKAASDKSIELYFEQTSTDLLKNLNDVLTKDLVNDIVIGNPSWIYTIEVLGNPSGQTFTINVEGVFYVKTATSSMFAYDILQYFKNEIEAAHSNVTCSIFTFGTSDFRMSISGTDYVAIDIQTTNYLTIVSSTTYKESVLGIWISYLNTNSDGLVFPTICNYKLFSDNNLWSGILNNYVNNAYLLDNAEESRATDFVHCLAPYVLLSKLFGQLEVDHNFQFTGSFLNETATQNLFFIHNQAINKALHNVYTSFTTVFETTIPTANFIPAMSATELIEGFQDLFCLAAVWSESYRTFEFKKRIDVLNTPIQDYTNKVLYNYKTNIPKRQGYRIEYENDKDDTTSNSHNQPITIGNGETKYNLKIASATQRMVYANSQNRELLYMEQINTGDFSPRLATIDSNEAKALILSDIHTNYWKDWAEFMDNAKAVNKSFKLSINDLLKLRTFENPMISFQSESGNVVGMIKSMRFSVGEGLSVVDMEILTVV